MAVFFEPLLLKYMLAAQLKERLNSNSRVSHIEVAETGGAGDPVKFFSKAYGKDAKSGERFVGATVRINFWVDNVQEITYYLYYRNGMSRFTDPTGSRRMSFARPSSVAFGYVKQGVLEEVYKLHYKDVFGESLSFENEQEEDSKIILFNNTVIDEFIKSVNQTHNLELQ